MSIKIRSLEELNEKLDEDIQWRKKEIADIKTLCRLHPEAGCLLRSGFTLTCAHFEGFIRYASNAYIAFISSQEILCSDLRMELSGILVRRAKHALFNNGSRKVKLSVVNQVLAEYDEILTKPFYIKLDDSMSPVIEEDDLALPTEGNPKPDVLQEITTVLRLDYSKLFELRSQFIDRQLLNPRHHIVHGSRWNISFGDLEEASNYVLEMLEFYNDEIINAAENNLHCVAPRE